MALYSKYRPQNFANLVGQDSTRLTLLHEIQESSISHAYLFAGPRGTGKTSTARLIAKALNCEKKSSEGEPCEECDFCKTITDGNLIDVIEIDAASNRGIDEIRDLKEKINFAPTRAKTKTYIIDEVHMLTKEAFNALLKTLEEPPENVYFILCTTEIHKIPETIISRCQRFDFKRIDVKTIMTRLNYIAQMEGFEAEDAAIELIARHVDGGLRDAIGLLEQLAIDKKLTASRVRDHLGITGNETIENLLDLLVKKEMVKAINLVNQVHNEGYDLNSFMRETLECLREKLISGIQNNASDSEIWLRMIAQFEETRDMQRNAVIPQLPLEIAVIKLCEKSEAIELTGADEKPMETVETPTSIDLESTEKAQKEEEKTATALTEEYEKEQYKTSGLAAWPRVLEQIQPPSLRRSLSDARVNESENGDYVLVFTSRFHMEKTNLVENRAKVEKAIANVFGKSAKAVCKMDMDADKKPHTKTEQRLKTAESMEINEERETKTTKPKNIAEKAMEIFGEE